MKTGNTSPPQNRRAATLLPQWSPVMKTGNTSAPLSVVGVVADASMEPGHEDREYAAYQAYQVCTFSPQWSPVMKTGNTPSPPTGRPGCRRLNGARS